MQAILDSLDEGVITATRDGVISGANVAAETMFGYDEDQAVGVRLSDLIVGNGDATIEKLLESTPSAKTGVGIELTGKRIDGREFPIELSVTSIDLFDGLRSLWTIRDNSERAQAEQGRLALEEQLRQSQKMEAIGTLAGGIAHDFNNMLGGIIGFAELAAEEAPKNSAIGGYLENVLSVSGQAVQLVKQILTFSRYQEEEKYVVELTRIIDECSSLIRQTIPSNIELVTEYRGASFTILANDTTMHQVIVNLYANAASAIGKHSGKIKLVLDYFDGIPPEDADQDSMARAVVDDQRRYVRMRLHDSGGGIPADILHRIFEPFFTTKDQGSGTGMGLAVVHSIIQNHSGWIEVDSADDGTTFTVYLPFVDEVPSFDDGESTVVLAESTGGERILAVDDDDMIADLLLRVLTRQGYEVVIAKNGEEAIRAYRAEADTFDLVITDQTMPGMNGDELVVEIFSIRADQPVILCTGYSNIITEEYALSMGIRRYLLKPVAIRELCKSVRSVLDENVVRDSDLT
ncbi:MAG: response regulator [Proteobacteria bacterium]|nr:response regulator [Pseudomonadota bacterium]